MKIQYRIQWKREGWDRFKSKPCRSLKDAERWKTILTSNKPWEAFGKNGDDKDCCSGHECACQGATVEEVWAEKGEGLPKIIEIKVSRREVGNWIKEDSQHGG